MSRARTTAAILAGAALAAAALVRVAQAQTLEQPDPLLSARMRELKRLRVELARLQAEIPRASNARRVAIDTELVLLDLKLERLLKQSSALEDAPINGWVPLLGPTLEAHIGKTYAAVVQLGFFQSMFANESAISSKLHELLPWSTLQVSTSPITGVDAPWTLERSSGRYWVAGSPAKDAQAPRPSELLEAFVR